MAIPLNIMQGLRRVKLVYFLQPLTVEKPKNITALNYLLNQESGASLDLQHCVINQIW